MQLTSQLKLSLRISIECLSLSKSLHFVSIFSPFISQIIEQQEKSLIKRKKPQRARENLRRPNTCDLELEKNRRERQQKTVRTSGIYQNPRSPVSPGQRTCKGNSHVDTTITELLNPVVEAAREKRHLENDGGY